MFSPEDTLLLFEKPVILSKDDKIPQVSPTQEDEPFVPALLPKASQTQTGGSSQCRIIMNVILPPRYWAEGKVMWVQEVSATAPSQLDVEVLARQLDSRLLQRMAIETGFCPTRAQLYAQCFDEMIRQEAVSCLARAVLMARSRDEARMTQEAFQKLVRSSYAFCVIKALQDNITGMRVQASTLEKEKDEMVRLVKQQMAERERLLQVNEAQRQLAVQKRSAEIKALQVVSQKLMDQLKDLTGTRSKE